MASRSPVIANPVPEIIQGAVVDEKGRDIRQLWREWGDHGETLERFTERYNRYRKVPLVDNKSKIQTVLLGKTSRKCPRKESECVVAPTPCPLVKLAGEAESGKDIEVIQGAAAIRREWEHRFESLEEFTETFNRACAEPVKKASRKRKREEESVAEVPISTTPYPLIGLAGRAGSGKDTEGKRLKSEFGYTITHMADPLKEGCRAFFGFNDEQLYGNLRDTIDPFWGFSPRKALQKLGTEGMRIGFPLQVPEANIGDGFWLKRFEKWMLDHRGERVAVCDIRFPNESELIRRLGGVVIRISRQGLPCRDHASENGIDTMQVDYDVSNDGTIDELHQKVMTILHSHMSSSSQIPFCTKHRLPKIKGLPPTRRSPRLSERQA
jgi:hypothetical protein